MQPEAVIIIVILTTYGQVNPAFFWDMLILLKEYQTCWGTKFEGWLFLAFKMIYCNRVILKFPTEVNSYFYEKLYIYYNIHLEGILMKIDA